MHKPDTALDFFTSALWKSFIDYNQLTAAQALQFQKYLLLLQEWNNLFNITAITDPYLILSDHFQDSLILSQCYSLDTVSSLADIGSGGGFPALPLKIKFPHLQITLIEVNNKKATFLQKVIDELELTECTISLLDWRTFLRKSTMPIDIFCARASLQPAELIRIFKPNCLYQESLLVYWASQNWVPEKELTPFIASQHPYTYNDKSRKLIFFKKPQATS